MIPESKLIEIIGYGVKAPSGDNCQPWTFEWDGEALLVLNDREKDTSLYNVMDAASYVAHGALIENMEIAAGEMGYGMTVELFPEVAEKAAVARVHFNEAPKKQSPLFPFIPKRSVNRRPYRKKRLDEAARKGLLDAAEGYGARLFIVEDDASKKAAARAASQNDRILFENRELHDFLFDHIRWTRREAQAAGDGMYVGTLGLDPVMTRLFRLLKPWPAVKAFNLMGFSRLVPGQSYRLCAGSSAMCLLQMPGASPGDFVTGGRALERVWLTAASLGLSIHPMTGVTYLIQRLHMEGGRGLSEAHRELLKNVEAELGKVFPLEVEKAVIMLFRTGYGPPAEPFSLRRKPALRLVRRGA